MWTYHQICDDGFENDENKCAHVYKAEFSYYIKILFLEQIEINYGYQHLNTNFSSLILCSLSFNDDVDM